MQQYSRQEAVLQYTYDSAPALFCKLKNDSICLTLYVYEMFEKTKNCTHLTPKRLSPCCQPLRTV